ncbi:hypothetical protein [Pseudomonas phage vB_PaeM_kmuB]|nr:hypothetical protein [Pseudomonas phage vB_PaeM_kmuB]WNV47952.1 hypothetical protein [Pseudomonas phage fMGyn-Pae01]
MKFRMLKVNVLNLLYYILYPTPYWGRGIKVEYKYVKQQTICTT